jgi:hypothetical protein
MLAGLVRDGLTTTTPKTMHAGCPTVINASFYHRTFVIMYWWGSVDMARIFQPL